MAIQNLREACDHFLIPFDQLTIQCQDLCGLLHESSNDGAKKQFEVFLEKNIFLVLVESAQMSHYFLTEDESYLPLKRGDRECQIVILCEDDYPPELFISAARDL